MRDRIETFNQTRLALQSAQQCLDELAVRENMTVTKAHAIKSRVIARRCRNALDQLAKVGEL